MFFLNSTSPKITLPNKGYMNFSWNIKTANILFPHLEEKAPEQRSGALQQHYTYWLLAGPQDAHILSWLLAIYRLWLYADRWLAGARCQFKIDWHLWTYTRAKSSNLSFLQLSWILLVFSPSDFYVQIYTVLLTFHEWDLCRMISCCITFSSKLNNIVSSFLLSLLYLWVQSMW